MSKISTPISIDLKTMNCVSETEMTELLEKRKTDKILTLAQFSSHRCACLQLVNTCARKLVFELDMKYFVE